MRLVEREKAFMREGRRWTYDELVSGRLEDGLFAMAMLRIRGPEERVRQPRQEWADHLFKVQQRWQRIFEPWKYPPPPAPADRVSGANASVTRGGK
jgi:hypothetical protein